MPRTRDRDDLPDPSRPAPTPLFPAYRLANEVPPAQLHWLWPQRLPHGAVTLLVGDPGVGKSLLTAEIAARITRGDSWPVAPGRPFQPAAFAHCAAVVHAATQDATDSVILSRLTAARADLNQVAFLDGARMNHAHIAWAQRTIAAGLTSRTDITPEPIDRPLRLPEDEGTIECSLRLCSHTHCLIIDPITDYVSPGVSITELFRSLTAVARRKNVAILATAHLSKTPTHRPIYRVRGSLEYVSAARSVLLLTADANDPTRRILHQIKSSYGPLAPPLAFHIRCVPSSPSPSVPSSASVPQSLYPSIPSLIWDDNPAPSLPPHLMDLSRERQCALHEAAQWLTRALESGPRPAHELRREAAQVGIAHMTLYRAKEFLNVASGKRPEFQKWSWWSL
jgi:putative DNA primase/helicase